MNDVVVEDQGGQSQIAGKEVRKKI